MYEKCTTDDKFKGNLRWKFDTKNHCSNYEGQALLSHYHEAAYDAHMTGVVFMHVLKHKEIELARIMSREGKNPRRGNQGAAASNSNSQASTTGEEGSKNPKDLKHQPVVLEGQYPKAQINKMMMDASGTARFYHLQPEQHVALVSIAVEQTEFPTTIHLEFQEGKINGLEATEISKMFEEYGDFFI